MARYKHIESAEKKKREAYEKAQARYALERKYNKASPSELLGYILEDPKNDVISYLYATKQ